VGGRGGGEGAGGGGKVWGPLCRSLSRGDHRKASCSRVDNRTMWKLSAIRSQSWMLLIGRRTVTTGRGLPGLVEMIWVLQGLLCLACQGRIAD